MTRVDLQPLIQVQEVLKVLKKTLLGTMSINQNGETRLTF